MSDKAITTDTKARLEPLAYGIAEAVAVSGLSRSSIYELIRSGELRSIKIAGRRLIPASELRTLLTPGDAP